MNFSERVAQIVEPLVDERAAKAHAAHVVAIRAPFLLRRFAEITAAFSTQSLPFDGGRILARRDSLTGYTSVEYFTYGLHITFVAEGSMAALTWRAGSESGTRIVTEDTLDVEIDAALYDAISAFANTRPSTQPQIVIAETA